LGEAYTFTGTIPRGKMDAVDKSAKAQSLSAIANSGDIHQPSGA
jgi:hypothetical protein